jgi:DNA-binding response OmpR family regulator/HEAT repeat protein
LIRVDILAMIRILSLDDDTDLLKLYNLLFERSGYDHTPIVDNYEAWVLLHADRFDLLTEDLMRPEVDGWKFLKAIEEDSALSSLPIVVITARAQEADQVVAHGMPRIDDYITKPVHPRELLERLQQVLLRHGLTPPPNLAWEAARARWAELAVLENCVNAVRDADPVMRCRGLATVRTNDKLRAHAAKLSPHICAALQDADPDVRLAAAKTAATLNDHNAIEPLLKLLNDPICDVANTALRALGQLNSPDGRVAILPLLHQSDWRLRCLAALALKSDYDHAVGSALSLLLSDEVYLVQLAATLALKEHSQYEVVEALSAQLSSSDQWLFAATVATLGSTHNPQAVDKLAPLLTDTDSYAIWWVIKAMQELGAAALPPLRELAAQDMPLNEHDWSVAKIAAQAVYTIENNL